MPDGHTTQQPHKSPSSYTQEHYRQEAAKFVASLPAPVQQRVKTLQELQTKRGDLEAEFKKELEALEDKYRKLYGVSIMCIILPAPHTPPPTQHPCTSSARTLSPPPALSPPKRTVCPSFGQPRCSTCPWCATSSPKRTWRCSSTSPTSPATSSPLTRCVRHCRCHCGVNNARLMHAHHQQQGFSITFHFAENPFFTNKTLVCCCGRKRGDCSRSTHMARAQTIQYVISYELPHEEPVLQKIVGAEINWRAGKDVTVKVRTWAGTCAGARHV